MSREIPEVKFSYSPIESIILTFAFLLILFFIILNFASVNVRQYFFKTMDTEIESHAIGKIINITGGVSREKTSESEFVNIKLNDDVYPNDALMTGKDSTVTVLLNTGEKIEMSSNSLIKLDFNFDFTLAQFIPKQIIESIPVVIAPKPKSVHVVSKVGVPVKIFVPAKKFEPEKMILSTPEPIIEPVIATPMPTPIPVVTVEPPATILNFKPKNDEIIVLNESELLQGFKKTIVEFELSKPEKNLVLSVEHINNSTDSTQQKPQLIPLSDNKSKYAAEIKFTAPGQYKWQVLKNTTDKAKESVIKMITTSFSVKADYSFLSKPVVSGGTNELKVASQAKVFDGFNIKWKKFDANLSTEISFIDLESKKLLKKLEAKTNFINYSKGEILAKPVEVFLVQNLKNGFKVFSEPVRIEFKFYPPKLISPAKDSVTKLGNSKKVFFTWTKTKFTDVYEFSISKDPGFKQIVFQKELKDNFVVMPNPQTGTYFWKVRSISKNYKSDFSESNQLNIQP